MNRNEEQLRWLVWLISTGLMLYLCWKMLEPFVDILLSAVVLVTVFLPLHQYILKKVKRPSLSALTTIGVILLIVIAPLIAITLGTISEATNLAGNMQGYLSANQDQRPMLSESGKKGCDFSKFNPLRMISETKRIKRESRPAYHEDAKRRGIEGRVVVKVMVDPDGLVRQACAINGDRILKKAAEKAALDFLFEPILLNGEKFSRFLEEQIVFEFKITDK